jgi:lipopolysaccharide biosynthesis protein
MLQTGADGVERYLMLNGEEVAVDPTGLAGLSRASDPRFFAFYLPQFHPIAENDEWWGPGFTDWTNVVRARPVVRGHYQPHIPADLGFYDLRLAEARAAQAAMAAEYGIDGFCYYHYWFHGRRLLERPFDEVLRSGQPDFPFCLCWANENWTRTWSGRDGEVLVRQTYSERDDLTHIRWLAEAFSDPRYLRIRGRPVFLVYRASSIPETARTTDTWRREAVRLGVGDPYLCLVHSFDADRLDPGPLGFDAAVKFAPDWRIVRKLNGSRARRGSRRVFHPRSPYRVNTLRDYSSVVTDSLREPNPDYRLYPCVSPGFDNTPRRPTGATVLLNSSPDAYETWLRETVGRFEPFGPEENLVFVNAWNEWAEGNHLEPCQQWGRAYLEAHARVVAKVRSAFRQPTTTAADPATASLWS